MQLGLLSSGLWAELKALRAQHKELKEAAGQRQLLLRELQAKQQRILSWRQLVVRHGSRQEWGWQREGPGEALEETAPGMRCGIPRAWPPVAQDKTQDQVRLLIKDNSASKMRLSRSPAEVRGV